jgi:hypothetical protein
MIPTHQARRLLLFGHGLPRQKNGKAEASSTNPTFADLLHEPCSVTGTQGISHLLQTFRVRGMNETVSFVDELWAKKWAM